MTEKKRSSKQPAAFEEDDTPEWTEDQFRRAELAHNGKVIRPAQGTLTRGRPKLADAKQVVTLRLPPSLIAAYGPDWRKQMTAVLMKAAAKRA